MDPNQEIETLMAEVSRLKQQIDLIEETTYEARAIFDNNLKCISINRYFTKLFQYTEKEFLHTHGTILIAPEYQVIVKKKMQEEVTTPYEAVLLRKDGSRMNALIQGLYHQHNGQRVRVTTFRDITPTKKIQKKLESLNEELDSIFNNTMVGIIHTGKNRLILNANQEIARMFGYDSPDEITGRHVEEFYYNTEDYKDVGDEYLRTLLKNENVNNIYPFKHKSGKIIWVSINGKAMDTQTPPDLSRGVIWLLEDVTEQRKLKKELELANDELESIFHSSMVGIIMLRDGRIIYRANRKTAEMLGFDNPQEIIGRSVEEFHLSYEKYQEFGRNVYNKLTNNNVIESELQLKRKDGAIIWVTISGKAIDHSQPAELKKGVIWVLMDITARKEADKKLFVMATTDDLTGAFNRREFMRLCRREFSIRERYGRPLAVLMFDLDKFKTINDEFGHSTGDLALQHFCSICRNSIRTMDIFGRLGGEEFALLLPDTDAEEGYKAAERIRKLLEETTPASDHTIPAMTVSIGLAIPGEGEYLEQILNKADKLLYQAKTKGRNRTETWLEEN